MTPTASQRLTAALRDLLLILSGALCMAVAVNVFLEPNNVVPGGFTALAIFANRLWGWPTGLTLLALNVPVLLLGMAFMGAQFGPKTILGAVTVSLGIDLLRPYLPVIRDDPLLYILYGGLLYGLGLALVFRARATTGGTEIPAKLLEHWYGIRPARSLLVMDGLILALAALFFGLAPALYALIAAWVMARVMDFVDLGWNSTSTVIIITSQPTQVREAILHELERGVTLLQAEGGYTGEPRVVMLTVINRRQTTRLREVVSAVDPEAFVVLSPSHDVLGEGFAPLTRPRLRR